NDRYEYTILAASLGKSYSMPWQKLQENEFLLTPVMNKDPEKTSHHLKLDHENEYIRLKSRVSGGPDPDHVVNKPEATGEPQGFEARDGSQGDGAWVEVVDCDNRGLWHTHHKRLSVWRAKPSTNIFQFYDEDNLVLAVINDPGPSSKQIKIICAGNVEILADQMVNIYGHQQVNIKSDGDVNIQAG